MYVDQATDFRRAQTWTIVFRVPDLATGLSISSETLDCTRTIFSESILIATLSEKRSGTTKTR